MSSSALIIAELENILKWASKVLLSQSSAYITQIIIIHTGDGKQELVPWLSIIIINCDIPA